MSPNALYRHIGDRDGLVVDMGALAATELTPALRAAAATRDEPVDALVALGVAYVDFALRRPAAYDAIVQAKPSADDPRRAAWHEPWLLLIEIVEQAVPDAAEATAFSLWATLHGRIDLSRSPAFPIDPRAGIDDATRALVRAFADAGPLSSPIQALETR
ncbi:MAG: TetR/AcrR family transcriptional regulator [Acidimicrobiales bacterium]